jgi:hypothetical protein
MNIASVAESFPNQKQSSENEKTKIIGSENQVTLKTEVSVVKQQHHRRTFRQNSVGF